MDRTAGGGFSYKGSSFMFYLFFVRPNFWFGGVAFVFYDTNARVYK